MSPSLSQTFAPSPAGLLPKELVSCCLGQKNSSVLLCLLGLLCTSVEP